jgi:hypothetical protein
MGMDEDTAVRTVVDDLLADRSVVGIFRNDGVITRISIECDPGHGYEWAGPRETMEYRYWSGKPWEGQGLGAEVESGRG